MAGTRKAPLTSEPRFSFYGLKAILELYFKKSLMFSDNSATLVMHTFVFFAYFMSVPGGYLADAFLGAFFPRSLEIPLTDMRPQENIVPSCICRSSTALVACFSASRRSGSRW